MSAQWECVKWNIICDFGQLQGLMPVDNTAQSVWKNKSADMSVNNAKNIFA